MSRELVIQSWCDVCGGAGERVVAAISPTVRLTPEAGTQEIDLCENHRDTYDDLVQLLGMFGRTVQRSHRRRTRAQLDAAANISCPDCPRTFSSPQGLGAHRYANHGYIGKRSGE